MKPEFTIYALHGLPTNFESPEARAAMRAALFPRPASIDWKSDRMANMSIVGPLEFSDYAMIRAKAEAIRLNPRVEQVLMYLNCPGGVAPGGPETAAALAKLNKAKPILCVAEGYCASAGYQLAAMATELIVSPTCLVGSVGTRSVLIDDSKMMEQLGVRVIPIVTGKDKAVGLEGVPVDDHAVQVITDLVNSYQRQFILSLKQSTFLDADKIVALAENASVWLGDEAVKQGFATRVGSFEQIVAELRDQESIAETRKAISAKQAIEKLKGEAAEDKYLELIGYGASVEDRQRIEQEFPQLCATVKRLSPDLFE
mgnify:CR=1 FL=1